MLAEKTGEERRRRPKARVDFMVGGGTGKWYWGTPIADSVISFLTSVSSL